jgi:hypothetical protein
MLKSTELVSKKLEFEYESSETTQDTNIESEDIEVNDNINDDGISKSFDISEKSVETPNTDSFKSPIMNKMDTTPSSESFRSPIISKDRFSLGSKRLDNRVQGDTASWITGPRLTIDGIKEAYGGLYETLLNTGSYISIFVQEFVVRPDTPLTTLMNTVAISAKSTQLIFSRRQRSQGLISYPQLPGSASSSSTTSSSGSKSKLGLDEPEKDWDVIDVQVVYYDLFLPKRYIVI